MDFFMRNEVIRRLTEMNIEQYGYQKADTIDCGTGIPARVTAVHRSHFEIVCDRGTGLARLKTGEYYGGNENVPATGDFVLVNWQEGSESLILRRFRERRILRVWIRPRRDTGNRPLQPTLIMSLSCRLWTGILIRGGWNGI